MLDPKSVPGEIAFINAKSEISAQLAGCMCAFFVFVLLTCVCGPGPAKGNILQQLHLLRYLCGGVNQEHKWHGINK